MTLRDVASDVISRQEPALAQHAIWAERAKMLRTDRLTGLTNRFGWNEELEAAMAETVRSGGPLIVARIDLDNRRSADLNEELTSFAARAHGVVRKADLFARLEGDVLVVALTRCPITVARTILERIRRSAGEGQACSVGWTAWNRQESADMLMDRASQALTAAQVAGGNRVVEA
ncbi:MAG: GGDEF domain-containing protein [Nocardioidaceae bacterium]